MKVREGTDRKALTRDVIVRCNRYGDRRVQTADDAEEDALLEAETCRMSAQ